jgi:hypothetical protein
MKHWAVLAAILCFPLWVGAKEGSKSVCREEAKKYLEEAASQELAHKTKNKPRP